MNRTFLGTAIGRLGGGPFPATEAVAVGTLGQTVNQRLARVHGLGACMRMKFRAAFLCRVGDEERWVWAPGVLYQDGWVWAFTPLVAVYAFHAGAVKLVDDQGYVIDLGPHDLGVARGDALRLVVRARIPPLAALRSDCTISPPCERLIVARHLGHTRANAQGAQGGPDGAGGGDTH